MQLRTFNWDVSEAAAAGGADEAAELGDDAFSKLQEDAAMVPNDDPEGTEQMDRLMIDAVTKIFQKTYHKRREAASAAIGGNNLTDGRK